METPDPKRLQFGERREAGDYADRPAAFGLVERDGKIAVVRIDGGDEPAYLDLPGGAVDPGEDEARALEREFGEEAGIRVRAVRRFERAAQFMWKPDGRTANNLCAFWAADYVARAPELKVEEDHSLQWLDPVEAMKGLKHEAHAWAVAVWLRSARSA